MIFARFLAVFLLSSVATMAVAADKPSPSASTQATQSSDVTSSPSERQAIAQPAAGATNMSGQPFWVYRMEPVIATLQSNGSSRIPAPRLKGRSLAELNGNVCYFMRTYKIKPTERIPEGQSASRGYSECEMASDYEIRSAIAHEKGQAELK